MQKHGNVVHLRSEANVEYKKDTVPMMKTASGILNVDQKIAQKIFHGILTAAMTLFQVRLNLFALRN